MYNNKKPIFLGGIIIDNSDDIVVRIDEANVC